MARRRSYVFWQFAVAEHRAAECWVWDSMEVCCNGSGFASLAVAAGRRRAPLAAVLLAAALVSEVAAQSTGLFTPVLPLPAGAATRVSPTPPDPLTLRRRLVTIDLGQLTPSTTALSSAAEFPSAAPAPVGVLRLNLFDDAVFMGIVERSAPTFSVGHVFSGQLLGIEWGTLTLVVNGDVVAGTIRTPEATYRIRPAGNRLHTVSQIDPSQLPPLGEPIPRRIKPVFL